MPSQVFHGGFSLCWHFPESFTDTPAPPLKLGLWVPSLFLLHAVQFSAQQPPSPDPSLHSSSSFGCCLSTCPVHHHHKPSVSCRKHSASRGLTALEPPPRSGLAHCSFPLANTHTLSAVLPPLTWNPAAGTSLSQSEFPCEGTWSLFLC